MKQDFLWRTCHWKRKQENRPLVNALVNIAAETGDVILFMKQGKVIQTIENENKIEETTMKLMKLHRQ